MHSGLVNVQLIGSFRGRVRIKFVCVFIIINCLWGRTVNVAASHAKGPGSSPGAGGLSQPSIPSGKVNEEQLVYRG
jgi:hypothetical protein